MIILWPTIRLIHFKNKFTLGPNFSEHSFLFLNVHSTIFWLVNIPVNHNGWKWTDTQNSRSTIRGTAHLEITQLQHCCRASRRLTLFLKENFAVFIIHSSNFESEKSIDDRFWQHSMVNLSFSEKYFYTDLLYYFFYLTTTNFPFKFLNISLLHKNLRNNSLKHMNLRNLGENN